MQSNCYADMLKRLNEYRKMLPMTRAEVANLLQVSEKCYNEFENGTKRIPCGMICKLHESGWDVNYIIAGFEDTGKSNLREKLLSYGPYDEKELILLFSWVFSNRIPFGAFTAQECREIELLEIIAKGYEKSYQGRQSVVRIVRETMHQSQEELAERMHICVKTYRNIEKNIAQSNARSLGELCELSGFRPSLFITPYVEWDIIEHIWQCLEEEEQNSILEFIRNGIQLMSA